MDIVSSDWSNRHKELNKGIRKAEYSAKAVEMILDLHAEKSLKIYSMTI